VTAKERASYRFCADVARREARNFYYSFLLLPRKRRASMAALYAFMRHTDDLADEPGPADAKRTAIETWRRTVDRALADGGDSEEEWQGLLALSDTVKRHQIPTRYLHEVIDGVTTDVGSQSFATFEDLYPYCYRVASAVGLCCLHIWGFESAGGKAEGFAEAYGLALQLTNILRDVREDALNDRVYLPSEDLECFGVSREELAEPQPNDRLRELARFEAERAAQFYEQGQPLVDLIDPSGRPMLRALVGIYHELLHEIARRDYDVWTGRVALPPWRKALLALGALAGWPARRTAHRPAPSKI
jgi:phytoene synthase